MVEIFTDVSFPFMNILTFPLIVYSICVFNFSGQTPKLPGKYLVTGCYHEH